MQCQHVSAFSPCESEKCGIGALTSVHATNLSSRRFHALSSFPTFLGFPSKLLPPLPTFLKCHGGRGELMLSDL